jgi:sortase A
MRKSLAVLLLAAGLLVLGLPSLQHAYDNYEQNKLLNEWESGQAAASSDTAGSTVDNNERLNELLTVDQQSEPPDTVPAEAAPTGSPKVRKSSSNTLPSLIKITAGQSNDGKGELIRDSKAIALIRIDSIKLRLPILEGVSNTNMRHAAVHMEGTAQPGKMGNCVIAAHNSYVRGRLFNRVHELETGGEIKLTYGGHNYLYKVIGKKIVKPTDVSVLKANDKERMLTLITCDDTGNKRVIIQAKLV